MRNLFRGTLPLVTVTLYVTQGWTLVKSHVPSSRASFVPIASGQTNKTHRRSVQVSFSCEFLVGDPRKPVLFLRKNHHMTSYQRKKL